MAEKGRFFKKDDQRRRSRLVHRIDWMEALEGRILLVYIFFVAFIGSPVFPPSVFPPFIPFQIPNSPMTFSSRIDLDFIWRFHDLLATPALGIQLSSASSPSPSHSLHLSAWSIQNTKSSLPNDSQPPHIKKACFVPPSPPPWADIFHPTLSTCALYALSVRSRLPPGPPTPPPIACTPSSHCRLRVHFSAPQIRIPPRIPSTFFVEAREFRRVHSRVILCTSQDFLASTVAMF